MKYKLTTCCFCPQNVNVPHMKVEHGTFHHNCVTKLSNDILCMDGMDPLYNILASQEQKSFLRPLKFGKTI